MDKTVKTNNLIDIKKSLDVFSSSCEKDLENYSKHLYSLREKAEKLSDSWSGSWVGFHASLYYGDFEKPSLQENFDVEWGSINGIPQKWTQKSFEDAQKKIEKGIVKTNFEYIFEKVKPLVKKAESLRNTLITELSFVKSDNSLRSELELVTDIEKLNFGTSANVFVKNMTPSQAWTRDSSAAAQGLKVPPHIKYQAQVMAVLSMISDIEKFVSLSNQLVRQLEIKFQLSSQGEEIIDSLEMIKLICDKFHSVTRQLRSRHSNRPTLEVEDEYDVQDLFHAILKIYFSDIRKEEGTPSFAGSTARTDFLLKNERLVVEIKKTSDKLKDKQLGEQIILDVAKYKAHPDCKTLICFVYDPDGRVTNPAGLISDINKLSNDELTVLVIIRPED